jgi:hypothetical protein
MLQNENSQNVPSIDYVTSEPPSQVHAQNYGLNGFQTQNTNMTNYDSMNDQRNVNRQSENYLPREPVILSQAEEESLLQDILRELGYYSSEDLKGFYSELTAYDPNLTGHIHHMYITLVAMRCKVI